MPGNSEILLASQPNLPVVKKSSGGCWRGASCFIFLLLLPLVVYGVLRVMGAFLIAGDPLEASDIVVVLGGGDEVRVAQAVRLVQQNQGKLLVITEPGEIDPGRGTAGQAVRALAIEAFGLSPEAIQFTDGIAHSTYDEAVAVRKLMEKHQYHTVVVVTDPYHTQRTRYIFRDVFGGSGLTVRVFPVQSHWYRSDTWFFSKLGWGQTAREYLKFAAYLLGVRDGITE